jgi:hypothetical protein
MATAKQTIEDAKAVTGCLGRSANDEEVFVLVARDELAPAIVQEWADRLEDEAKRRNQISPKTVAKIAEARQCAARMLGWQRAHASKLPD